jgi:hypothetical protein
MAWIEDLTHCGYLDVAESHGHPEGKLGEKLLAVGWLEGDHPYATGKVPEEVIRKLSELLNHPWQPIVFLGPHSCSLCESSSQSPARGYHNLFVPGLSVVYGAPSMIRHYILDHSYEPPWEFCKAVLDCPPMNSGAYFDALAAAAGSGWEGFFAKQQ